MANLLKDVYTYRWRAPGWFAGPVFVVSGLLVLLVGFVTLHGDPKLIAVGLSCLAIGAAFASIFEGFDYEPKQRRLTKWSSRLGVRRGTSYELQEGSWLALEAREARHRLLLCWPDNGQALLLETGSADYAQKTAKNLARVCKLEFRDTADPAPPLSADA